MWLIPDILTKNGVYQHFIGIINIKPHFLTSRNINMRKLGKLWIMNITVTYNFQNFVYLPIFVAKVANFLKAAIYTRLCTIKIYVQFNAPKQWCM